MRRKFMSGKNKPLMAVLLVAVVGAVSYAGFAWYNTSRVSAGKSAVGGIGFSVALVVAGALAMFTKKLKVVAAPLLMVGAALLGVEGVRKIGTGGLAGRYRLGQNRPMTINDGMRRPVTVSDGMSRPSNLNQGGYGVSGVPLDRERSRTGRPAF